MKSLVSILTEGKYLKHTKEEILDLINAHIEGKKDIRGARLNDEEKVLEIFWTGYRAAITEIKRHEPTISDEEWEEIQPTYKKI